MLYCYNTVACYGEGFKPANMFNPVIFMHTSMPFTRSQDPEISGYHLLISILFFSFELTEILGKQLIHEALIMLIEHVFLVICDINLRINLPYCSSIVIMIHNILGYVVCAEKDNV